MSGEWLNSEQHKPQVDRLFLGLRQEDYDHRWRLAEDEKVEAMARLKSKACRVAMNKIKCYNIYPASS